MNAAEREQLLAERELGIGGSDAPSLWSLEPYGCRRKLWYEKTKTPADFPFTGNKATERGSRMEPIIADIYAEQTGRELEKRGVKLVSLYPGLLYHIDRLIKPCDGRGYGVGEFKCPGLAEFARFLREGAPYAWIVQVHHGMLLYDCSWASIAVFNCERWELRHVDIERDDDICERIAAEGCDEWARIKAGGQWPDRLAPDKRCKTCPWRTKCQGSALLELDEIDDGGEIPIDESINDTVREFIEARGLRDDAVELFDGAHAKLSEQMGDRTAAACLAGRVSFKPQASNRIDSKMLRERHPEIAAECSRESVSRPLRVVSNTY